MTELNALRTFLEKSSLSNSVELPLVHSTSAYAAKKIIFSEMLKPQPCNVFKGEDLTYLFYGRPSYKKFTDNQISKYWELPAVFIIDYAQVEHDRVFPFDSGAFEGKRYPSFINMMDLKDFEVSATKDAPKRLVAAFSSMRVVISG
jgi:hypothetical protein